MQRRFLSSLRGFMSLIALTLALTAGAAAGGLSGTSMWSGQYGYSTGQAAVPFTLTLHAAADGSFTGLTTEPATFGNGSARALTADVSGSINGRRIYFKKTYDGSGGQSHTVEYNGTLSPDGHTMSGTWKVDTLSGSFSAELVSP
jgi:hypothetical protein